MAGTELFDMVEKITFFEPHFDGAQFGPASMTREDEPESAAPVEHAEPAAGRSRAVPLLVAGGLTLGLVLGLLGLRRVRRGEDTVQVELDEAHEEELAAQ